jgi:hypothetical protein
MKCYNAYGLGMERKYEVDEDVYEGMPAEIKQVVQACLEVEVEKRPSIAAILQMDFFSLPVHTLQERWAGTACFSPLGQLLKI